MKSCSSPQVDGERICASLPGTFLNYGRTSKDGVRMLLASHTSEKLRADFFFSARCGGNSVSIRAAKAERTAELRTQVTSWGLAGQLLLGKTLTISIVDVKTLQI
jgi:hypothetical protein